MRTRRCAHPDQGAVPVVTESTAYFWTPKLLAMALALPGDVRRAGGAGGAMVQEGARQSVREQQVNWSSHRKHWPRQLNATRPTILPVKPPHLLRYRQRLRSPLLLTVVAIRKSLQPASEPADFYRGRNCNAPVSGITSQTQSATAAKSSESTGKHLEYTNLKYILKSIEGLTRASRPPNRL